MASRMINCNYADMLVEEIALEGLDGITFPSLWLRLESRNDVQFNVDEKVQMFLWQAVVCQQELTFYQLPEPRPDIEKFDRFQHFNKIRGVYYHPDNLAPEPYPFEPVNENGVVGSCATFKTRKDITSEIRDEDFNSLCSYREAMDRWGQSLVVVASQSQRNFVLTGNCILPSTVLDQLQHFYLLERIARTRWNGLTSGSFLPQHSTCAISMNVKYVFFSIAVLRGLGLARKQILRSCYQNQSVMVNLFHLNRFYHKVPNFLTNARRSICEYLSSLPGKLQRMTVVKEKFDIRGKHYQKVLEKLGNHVIVEKMAHGDAFPSVAKSRPSVKDRIVQVMVLKKEFSGEDEEEEEEDQEEQDELGDSSYQRKIGRLWDSGSYAWQFDQPFLQQIYGMIHNFNTQGITLTQLATSMSLSYRIARNAVRCLETIGIIQSTLRAEGQHRVAIYFAQPFWEESHQSFGKALEEFQQKTTELPAETPSMQDEERTEDKPRATAEKNGQAAPFDPLTVQEDVHGDGEEVLTGSQQLDLFPGNSEPAPDSSIKLSSVTCTFLDDSSKNINKNMANPIQSEKLTEKMLTMANAALDVLRHHRVVRNYQALRSVRLL